jgi:GH35 family endo-1,4-beta-xylanase
MNKIVNESPETTEMVKLLEGFDKKDPATERRINEGIENNRKGDAVLRLFDTEGHLISDAKYSLKLVRHHFLFGANAFMLGGYGTEAENAAYETAFTEVFNSAVVPFFWSDLEPEPGLLRFGVDSPKIARRPPPDEVLDFCKKYTLTPKGHCLVWHQFMPDWLPSDPEQVMSLIYKRLDEISEAYGDQIEFWDLVNEPMEKFMSPNKDRLPEDYVFRAFKHATDVFPESSRLILNEATVFSWREFHGETTGLDLLVRNLQLRGARVGGLGMQYHYFFYDENGMVFDSATLLKSGQHLLDPDHLLKVLDGYGRMGIPLNVSEITIPAYDDVEDGEWLQARLTEELYRVWFSHPDVNAINWWNLADGNAHANEGRLKAGLLRDDLSAKPSYEAIRRLVKEEWTTRLEGAFEHELSFRGFYGDYALEVEFEGTVESHSFQLLPDGASAIDIHLGQGANLLEDVVAEASHH